MASLQKKEKAFEEALAAGNQDLADKIALEGSHLMTEIEMTDPALMDSLDRMFVESAMEVTKRHLSRDSVGAPLTRREIDQLTISEAQEKDLEHRKSETPQIDES